MPKFFRENPAYIVVPVFLLIIGAVFIFAKIGESASEWEKVISPAGYDSDNSLRDVTMDFSGQYHAWAVGGKNTESFRDYSRPISDFAIVYTYNPVSRIWVGQTFPACPYTVFPGFTINVCGDFSGISYTYNSGAYKLWAAGGNEGIVYRKGYIAYAADGQTWSSPQLIDDAHYFYDVSFIKDSNPPVGWVVGGDYNSATTGATIYKTIDGSNWTKQTTSPANLAEDLYSVDALDLDHVVAVGESGRICKFNKGTNNWTCITKGTDNLNGVSLVYNADKSKVYGFIAVNASKYLYFDSSYGDGLLENPNNWQVKTTGTTVTDKMNSVDAVVGSSGLFYVWFAGSNGNIIFGQVDPININNTSWNFQSTGVTAEIKSVSAANPTHAWAAGYVATKKSGNKYVFSPSLLKLSPGNLFGWGYVGADNCANGCSGTGCLDTVCTPVENVNRTYPLAWLSFNCADRDVCDSTTFSYGVNIKKKKEVGQCSDSPTTPCNSDDECSGTCVLIGDCSNNLQDKDVAALTGYAWFGNQDINETLATAKCNVGSGPKYCSNNPTLECTNDAFCASCLYNPASCFSSGWLSFNRDETDNPPACPYRIGDNTCPDYVTATSFRTTCNKIISSGNPEDSAMAFFDYNSFAISGWARFKIGQCSDDLTKACYKNSNCAGTCQYNNKDWQGGSNYNGGWVKLRGGTHLSSPPSIPTTTTAIYESCDACQTIDPNGDSKTTSDDNGDEYLVCKICKGQNVNNDNQTYACNLCGDSSVNNPTPTANICGNGRCNGNLNEPCLINSTSSKDRCKVHDTLNPLPSPQWGTCVKSGFCSVDSGSNKFKPCVDNSFCACQYLSATENYNTCNKCSQCDQYGVSLDIDGGDSYGYAWSEDFGWIDMTRVGLYNTAWFKTEYGDVYAGGDIGTQKMTKAPGYYYENLACNATYLALAKGSIVNFCTGAYYDVNFRTTPSSVTPSSLNVNPWLVQGYRAFNLPKSTTSAISILGKVDYNWMTSHVSSGYGPLSSGSGPVKTSTNNAFAPNSNYNLNGHVIYVNDDLNIDSHMNFIRTAGQNGSGLIVVSGNLTIDANITYDTATTLANMKELPSVGFYVKGDITISANVTQVAGSYYAEGKIISQAKSGELDDQLQVSGLMIASEFQFNRRFKGTIDHPQPAELITYDGRVQLNPPPGFRDLSKALPKVKESTP